MKVENKTKITTKDIALEPSSTKSLGTKGSFKESAFLIKDWQNILVRDFP